MSAIELELEPPVVRVFRCVREQVVRDTIENHQICLDCGWDVFRAANTDANLPPVHDGAGAAPQACRGGMNVQRSRDNAHARALRRRALHQLIQDVVHARHAAVHIFEHFADSRRRWNVGLQKPRGQAHRGHRVT